MPTKQSDRQMRYAKESIKVYRLSLNVRTDADIIAKLDSLPSKQGYIKQLIRADMEKQPPCSAIRGYCLGNFDQDGDLLDMCQNCKKHVSNAKKSE